MTFQPVTVSIDNCARLISAVLAATDWPDREQQRRRHRAHTHARGTARRVEALAYYPAATTMQRLLNTHTPLEAIYGFALSLSWPELQADNLPAWVPDGWTAQLADFMQQAALEAWWHDERAMWQAAYAQTLTITDGLDFPGFLEPFIGPVQEDLLLMPNICYPSDIEIGVRLGGQLFCLIPPRISWGDNEPWPFDEDGTHIIRGALSQYTRLLVTAYLHQHAATLASAAREPLPITDEFRARYPTWDAQFTALFEAAAVALFLQQTYGTPEAKAYILMENKMNGLRLLSSVVNVLQLYLADYDAGRCTELADYLPHFTKTLLTVKRMYSP